jgi:hypothetical protein
MTINNGSEFIMGSLTFSVLRQRAIQFLRGAGSLGGELTLSIRRFQIIRVDLPVFQIFLL